MLLISALLSFATEFKQEGPRYGWHDGVAMVFAVLLLLAFSSITSYWRKRKTIKLAKKKGEAMKFNVQRHQEFQLVDLTLSMYDIVVGDMVYLSPPHEVPANGLLLGNDNLVLVEGMKNEKIVCEANPFLIASSKVVEGHGWMLVTSVQNKSNSSEFKRRLLENLIEKPISYLDKASLFIFTLVALVLFIRLICKKDGYDGGLPDIKGNVSVNMLTKLLENIFSGPRGRIAILAHIFSVIILCVQHGVPLMITLSLHYQSDEVLTNQEVVLNDMSACTTMGLVNVICIDVSGGGLICKPMEVCEIWIGEGEVDINNIQESGTSQVVLEKLKEGVCLSILASGLSRSHVSNSLVSWANTTLEMDTISFREKFHILKHGKLDSNQERNGVLVRKVSADEQDMHLHWSGDASIMLEICSQYYDSEGTCHSIENQKIKFEQVIKKMECSGLKPIAFAYKQTRVQELKQDEMTLLALIGLKYKCQESTKLALKNLQNNGMRIKLVSEDGIRLLNAMACELGMEVSIDGGHLEGKQLRDLNEKARLVKLDKAIAMGSFSPKDKLLMVKCLQDRGDVVAFVEQRLTTNHISDVLKLADVGIIHHSSSKIIDRKESSDISITCFSALETIVKVGRSKYHNIQKFIQLQLTIGILGLLITLITTIFTGNSPLTAIQLIWVNALMCLLGGLMMVTELSSEEELAKLTSHRNQSIITKKMWKNIIFQILYQASAIMMILEFGGHVSESEKQLRKVMIFNTFFLCQLFHLLNIMDLLKTKVFKVNVQKYCFLLALGCCFALQTVIVEYAKSLADCMRLNATEWAICVLVSSISWVLKWTLKKILSAFSTPTILHPWTLQSTPQPLFYLYWGLPAMMLILFPIGLVSMKLLDHVYIFQFRV